MKQKIIAILMFITLLICFPFHVVAQEKNNVQDVELDMLENEDGISIVFVRNEDGSYSSYEINSNFNFPLPCSEGVDGVIEWAVFHLGFKDWNDNGDLYFTITADEPLRYIQGEVYIKSMDFLFPKKYLQRSFYNYLGGSSNTSRFLSQNVDVGGDSSVRVGFRGVTITAISGDTASIPDNSKVVYK